MQFVSNFLVQFGPRDQADNLFFTKAELRVEKLVPPFWTPAGCTNPVITLTAEFPAAAKTASQGRTGQPQSDSVHNALLQRFCGYGLGGGSFAILMLAPYLIENTADRVPEIRQSKLFYCVKMDEIDRWG
jgi:hypothetical protein